MARVIFFQSDRQRVALERVTYLLHDFEVVCAESASEVLRIAPSAQLAVVAVGDAHDRPDGFSILENLRDLGVRTVIICAAGQWYTVRESFRLGAVDVLTWDELEQLPRIASETTLTQSPAPGAAVSRLVGHSPLIQALREKVRRVAPYRDAVLITGETGTGKELVSREIHRAGRAPHPFVIANCAALPSSLIEAELFGHVKGAFTGATADHAGRFATARNGTVFLDEIGDLPVELQGRLLRVLQEGTFQPVGSSEERVFSGRIVAATHVDLPARVAAGQFREDLFYRLTVVRVHVPALRERRDDIEELLAEAIKRTERRLRFTADALRFLRLEYDWPGNVRELEAFVRRTIILSDDVQLTRAAVESTVRLYPRETASRLSIARRLASELLRAPALGERAVDIVLRELRLAALRQTRNNISGAARLIGEDRRVLARELAAHESDFAFSSQVGERAVAGDSADGSDAEQGEAHG